MHGHRGLRIAALRSVEGRSGEAAKALREQYRPVSAARHEQRRRSRAKDENNRRHMERRGPVGSAGQEAIDRRSVERAESRHRSTEGRSREESEKIQEPDEKTGAIVEGFVIGLYLLIYLVKSTRPKCKIMYEVIQQN